jgi:hypothetical protein
MLEISLLDNGLARPEGPRIDPRSVDSPVRNPDRNLEIRAEEAARRSTHEADQGVTRSHKSSVSSSTRAEGRHLVPAMAHSRPRGHPTSLVPEGLRSPFAP